ncbi:caspase family protein [Rhizobium ruizarguesonis]|uniref:caspase family protein n=1 Tax=Rhizobium ruizarguesonis TaxID=2081791 RepID=UPI00102F4AB8|nr:caspase family protein [Rhizobium ruizarguesonis]TBA72887.1 caspase [Rhizobium ruizarguesonis]WSH62363.1 caspase family protein [Rhizobium ruizarguesonis]
MPKALYGLLVAIDEYRSPVPRLNGCVNDIDAVRDLLQEVGSGGGFEVNLQVLKDANATRYAVVGGFREHLTKAGPEDVALFYYSGHGSQEDAPPEFWHLEPDRLDETLVCYDSRDEGQWDLADKELAALIAEVARPGPHVLCILDCCHSGSGTRAALEEGIAVRRAPTDRRSRPIGSFLGGALIAASDRGDGSLGAGWSVMPSGKHLLLAACRSSETAKEVMEAGTPHGAFTAALLSVLRQTCGSITYRDLLKRADAQVRLRVAQQVPQVEASDPSDLQRLFLGGRARQQRANFTLRRDKALGWVIDAGAVHGIARPAGSETTLLAIFDLQAAPADWREIDTALATAEVEEVRPEQSRVKLSFRKGELDQNSTYRAVVIATPLPVLGVHLFGVPDALEGVRRALATSGGGGPSTLVREVADENEAELRLDAADGSFRISRAQSDRPLVAEIVGLGDEAAKASVQRLEHVARWETVARLENTGSRLGSESIEIVVLQLAHETYHVGCEADSRHSIRLEYRYADGKWVEPKVRIELRNKGREDVYCALLWLGSDYSVSSGLIQGGTVHIPAGKSAAAYGGMPVSAFVPDEMWLEGKTEVRDVLKLIASTEQFDATLFDQEELDRYGVIRAARSSRLLFRNTIERLAARVHDRTLRIKPGGTEAIPDWATGELAFVVVRPLEATPVPPQSQQVPLGADVTLLGHPALKAKARLISPTEAGRGLGDLGLPAILRDDPEASQPFLFEISRGTDPGLCALQFIDIENPETVTADTPLVLRLQTQLRPGEHVLPFAWDGEFFLPLGVTRPFDAGTEVELRQLPAPIQTASDVERGIVSSVRILFQKILNSKLGTEFDYPHLAAISFDAESPRYETTSDVVRARVAHANRILLYIHGILGDTLGMTISSRAEIALLNAPPQHIGDRYDLVLAFDYENINTGIKETAKALKERLATVGLAANHNKTLHVAAHSMGGLVARWFIEREGGNKVVQRLVTLGTPHAGSPWPKIQDWATAALAIGLNGLTQVAWPVKVLGDLVGAIETVDVTLDEMAPGSPLLVELSKSPDPKVPYALLVGNTSIIPVVAEGAMLERLLSKLAPQRVLHAASSLAFLRAPNDIAVSVASAMALPGDRVPEPLIAEVACDHVTFFTSDAGRQALLDALEHL